MCWLRVRPWTRFAWDPYFQPRGPFWNRLQLGHTCQRPTKIQATRECDHAPIFALSSEWKDKFLNPSKAHCTMEALATVRRLDHDGQLDESPQDNKQKTATTLHRDELQKQDFAKLVSLRVTRILGQAAFALHRFWPR